MTRIASAISASLMLAGLPAAGLAQPAPPPGAPGVHRSAEALAATLAAAAETNPSLAVSPVLTTERYSVLEVRRGSAGAPASHPGWSELHFILDGSGVMVTGGRIVAGADGGPASIQGGVTQKVKKGDAVMVPPDTPHQYVTVDGAVTTLEVRFPDAAPVANK